jgi:aspartate ammonia-lyase
LGVPDDVYYGVHTERGRQNFAVSGRTIGNYPQFLACLAMIKKAAALANEEIEALPTPITQAICTAADEIISGKMKANNFPVDMIQGGGCVSTHMNINEVIALRANEILTGEKNYEFVHPNNHVNMGQSTNDVLPSALKLTLHFYILNLLNSLQILLETLEEKQEELKDVVKLSRTCLQDALPITMGQTFSAYISLIKRNIQQLEMQADICLEIPLGATAVGTGLGARKGYVEAVYPHLQKVTGLMVRKDPNFFDGLQNGDTLVQLSGTLKAIATGISKMATDFRIMSSGNRSGMKEITLPAVQAGSSIMPGKINPSYPELMNQIAYQVCGNDLTVTMAVEGIELELNIWDSIIAKALFENLELLTRSIPLFALKCVKGIEANKEECLKQAESTLSLAVVVATVYGYETGVKVAKFAHKNNLTIKQASIQLGIMSEQVANELLDVKMLTDAQKSAEITERMAEIQKQKTKDLISSLSLQTRQKIYEAVGKVIWADDVVSRQEKLVMEMMDEALQLEQETALSEKDDLDDWLTGDYMLLSERDKEIVFICAAWFSEVDDEVAGEELAMLEEIRQKLNISDERANHLIMRVHKVHVEKAELVPQWEASAWWEELERLLVLAMEITN